MQKYLKLLRDIKANGTYKPAAREGMPGTQSLFGYQFRHNLADGFPLLTTKKVSFKNVVVELLWFLRGDSNLKFLHDNGCHIWDEDYEMFKKRNNWTEEGCMGYQYPSLWRSWGKIDIKWQPKPNFKDPFFYKDLPNMQPSKSKFVGKTIKTKQGYNYVIFDYDSKKNIYYIVFSHNGLRSEKKGSQGFENVKYPYHKTSLGVACIGRPSVEKKLHKKLYSTWRGMINRCYDVNNISYYLYGGKGVYIDNRWLCFEYFVEDVQNMKNWELKKNNWKKYTLEKDFGAGHIYSKEDCIWSLYNFSKLHRPIYYKLSNIKTGEIVTTNNFAEFGRIIGREKLVNSHAKKLIDGRLKTLGGWKLLKTEDKSHKGIDQIKILIEGLKNNPMSRRHIVTSWNPATLNDMALNACHCLVQFNCRPIPELYRSAFSKRTAGEDSPEAHDADGTPKYYLDCQLYQRSADSVLGVPFNIASYALLTEILAKMCNMVAGEYVHTFGDVHIYENHKEAVKEQLTREPTKLPTLELPDSVDWDVILTPDFNYNYIMEALVDYNPQARIKAKLSTGLK